MAQGIVYSTYIDLFPFLMALESASASLEEPAPKRGDMDKFKYYVFGHAPTQ